jgi:putative aldouronate transport system substrate-binding protein
MKATKISSVFYRTVLVLSGITSLLFAGCGKETGKIPENQISVVDGRTIEGNVFLEGTPIVKEPVTLTIFNTMHPSDEWSNSWEKKPFVQKAEKETGIKTIWINADANKTAAVLASGDLPDIFNRSANENLISSNAELFYAFTDETIQKYLPHVLDFYNKSVPNWKDFLVYPDGNIYGLMGGFYNSKAHITDSLTWININWLKNVGKSMPTTTDEFYDVLKAFKTQDADGNGDPNDEIPMNFATKQGGGGIEYVAGYWGIYGNYNVKDGKILPSVNTKEYREYLEYCHKLIAEGLVNKEGFSQTGEQYISNLKTMKSGVMLGWSPITLTGSSDPKMISQFETMPFLTVPGKGDIGVAYSGSKHRINAGRTCFVLAKNGKNKEAAMRWWDYLSQSQDMAMFVAAGEEGVVWERGNDGKVAYYLKDMSPEQGAKYNFTRGATAASNTSLGLKDGHPLLMEYFYANPAKYPLDSGVLRIKGIEKIYEYISEEPFPQFLLPKEKVDERSLLEVDLLPYIAQFRADVILNGLTDVKWDNYVKGLNSYRYNDYLKWMQDYYDHKF